MGLEKTPVCSVLAELEPGEAGIIHKIDLPLETQQFLMRFGLFPGVEIRVSWRAPFGDPTAYQIDGAEIALRAETTKHIFVTQGRASLEEGTS